MSKTLVSNFLKITGIGLLANAIPFFFSDIVSGRLDSKGWKIFRVLFAWIVVLSVAYTLSELAKKGIDEKVALMKKEDNKKLRKLFFLGVLFLIVFIFLLSLAILGVIKN